MKEKLKNKAACIAVQYKISYRWSGGKVLLAIIIGVKRLAADYPHLPAYIQPVQPATAPTGLPARPSATELHAVNDVIEILTHNWAVVQGFVRAMGENIHEAIDTEFFNDLQYHVYGYDDV